MEVQNLQSDDVKINFEKSRRKYQIIFVSSEVGPWSKTGDLGEVLDGLPIALAKLGHRVMTISPRWDQYYDAWDTSILVNLEVGNTITPVRFFHTYKERVDRLFVDHPIFLERVWGFTGQRYYGPCWGKDWNDSQVRFSLFVRAALRGIRTVPVGGYVYGENCVIVCNDWHTCLLPLYMQMEKELWKKTKLCLLIHNILYQGRFAYEPWMADAFNLHESFIQELRCNMSLTLGSKQSKTDSVNWMRGSLKYFDKLITVSPTYATEIMHDPLKGVELSNDLFSHRGNGVIGILNGLKNTIRPNSETLRRTANLPFSYDVRSLNKKSELKRLFQHKVGLPVNESIPLLILIGRLDIQKGVDVVLNVLQSITLPKDDLQVCVIGHGREDLVAKVTRLKVLFPEKFVGEAECNGPERYLAYAGSDFVLIPSRLEPCGFVQMEAMRFGTLPIVTPTGGLLDTVVHMKTGIVCRAEIRPGGLLDQEAISVVTSGINDALDLFFNKPEVFAKIRRAAMKSAEVFTWDRAARKYDKVFAEINVTDISELCFSSNDSEDCDGAYN